MFTDRVGCDRNKSPVKDVLESGDGLITSSVRDGRASVEDIDDTD